MKSVNQDSPLFPVAGLPKPREKGANFVGCKYNAAIKKGELRVNLFSETAFPQDTVFEYVLCTCFPVLKINYRKRNKAQVRFELPNTGNYFVAVIISASDIDEPYSFETLPFEYTQEICRANIAIDGNDSYFSFGEKNPDKIFFVHRRIAYAGFLSNWFCALSNIIYAIERGFIPVVDYQTYPNGWNDDLMMEQGINGWENFFLQPCGFDLRDVLLAKHVIVSDKNVILRHDFPTTKLAGGTREIIKDELLRRKLRDYANKYIRPNPQTSAWRLSFLKSTEGWSKEAIGVYARGSDYRPEYMGKTHFWQPDISEIIVQAENFLQKYKTNKIVFFTEDEEYYEIFTNHFNDKNIVIKTVDYDRCSVKEIGKALPEDQQRGVGRVMRDMLYYFNLLLLSECKYFIGGINNGSAFALVNGDFVDYYIFDKGNGTTNDYGEYATRNVYGQKI